MATKIIAGFLVSLWGVLAMARSLYLVKMATMVMWDQSWDITLHVFTVAIGAGFIIHEGASLQSYLPSVLTQKNIGLISALRLYTFLLVLIFGSTCQLWCMIDMIRPIRPWY